MPPKIASIPAGGGAPEKEVFKLPHSGTTFEYRRPPIQGFQPKLGTLACQQIWLNKIWIDLDV